MALTQNTGLRDSLATAWGNVFISGTIEIRTSGDAVLATIPLSATPFGSPSTGTISKNGTWSVTATGTGTATKAVFISSDTNKSATVSVATSGGDLTIDNDAIVTGGTVTITSFSYTVPAS